MKIQNTLFLETTDIVSKHTIRKPKNPKYIHDGKYKRSLKDRHVQLIALGGIIGSGYFLGTGEIIKLVGPAVFLAYILGGLIIYLTMLSMGELATAIPVSGSFINYSSEFISPSFACGVGWSYWITWIAYIPAECVAGGIIMELFTGINGHLWALAFGLMVTFINLAKVDTFGEIEFWLAIIKIVALMAFAILAITIFFGIIPNGSSSQTLGLTYLTESGGFLPNGSVALLTAMVLLLVNYQGSEIIGLAAGESEDPARMIPHAVRNVVYRIFFIYVIPVFCLVLIFPWQKAELTNSVFADALSLYGLKWAAGVASFVTLTATISCANSGFYASARALNSLARDGMAPSFLANFNKNGVPQNATIATLAGIWVLLSVGYFLGQTKLYVALLLISGFTGTLAWISLCWAQINFRKKLYQLGYTIKDLRFVTPYSPYTGILAILLMIASLGFLLLSPDPIYKIAFGFGILSLVIPMLLYAYVAHKNGVVVKDSLQVSFADLFPPRDEKTKP